jgi:hypothetical protein
MVKRSLVKYPMRQGADTMDPNDIGNLIREYAHLTDEKIRGYLERTLDSDSLEWVEKHLRSCAYCTKEVQILREALDDAVTADHLDMSDDEVRREAVRILDRIRFRLGKVYFGDRTFGLEAVPGYPDLLGLGADLVLAEFEDAIDEDKRNTGAYTLSIEGQDLDPIHVPMRDFRDVNDIDVEEMKLVASTRKIASRETPEQPSELDLVFVCQLPGRTLEVLSHRQSTALFLRLR